MPSIAYQIWAIDRADRLEEVETAHSAIRGPAAARRAATRQLNHAYTVLLAAEFQGFCRDLHDAAIAALEAAVPPAMARTVADEFRLNRQLDRANANPSTLGSDFGRFGLVLWSEVDAIDPRGPSLRRLLDEMNAWRNAVAHSDFNRARLGGTMSLPIRRVRRWRTACHRLARRLDAVVRDRLTTLIGIRPWA
jgi:hypothetical protein